MKDLFECGICGVITETSGDLCQPRQVEGIEDYCGTAGETAEMCGIMRKTHEFECGICGRAAESAELVCNPAKTR